ncbi:MAG TPA: VOC family protein [Hyphomonadaceae bacterium]|nr:VOC family protein [Hyphomonadaceae bacterium]
MKLFRGRMIDHVHLRARDLAKTRHFYGAVMDALDIPIGSDGQDHLQYDELWIDALGKDAASATHVHLAFQAVDRGMVDRFYKAGVEAGGRDNGKPGERSYHPGYYAAFLLDPDGNNIEAVYHGAAKRSAEAVTLTFDMP